MEQPKDYYEYYKERFSKRDVDDAKANGFLGGVGASIVLLGIAITLVKCLPVG